MPSPTVIQKCQQPDVREFLAGANVDYVGYARENETRYQMLRYPVAAREYMCVLTGISL